MSENLSFRAANVLALMRDPDRIIEIERSDYRPPKRVRGREYTKDGKWFQLQFIPNVGRTTVKELMTAGLIEYSPLGDGDYAHWRCRVDEYEEDFGDLWVAA